MEEYEMLSQQEKDAIIARHHFIVDKLNETLGNVLHYEDEAILRKLDDPKEVAVYRMFAENKRRQAERDRIFTNLVSKYGRGNPDSLPMNRTIKYCLRVGNDPESIAYNEKLYQEYITNPQNVVYREFKKVMTLNPQELYNLGNDKKNMGEFYMNNTEVCQNAFAFDSVMSNGDAQATKPFRAGIGSMRKLVETLNEYGNVVKQGGIDGLACPTLTPEQAALAMSNEMFLNQQNEDLNIVLNLKLRPLDTPHDYFKHFIDAGMDIDNPDFFATYRALYTDPETGAHKEVSFDRVFVEHDPNVRIERRSPEEIFQIKCINSAFQAKYAAKFQSRIAAKLNERIFDANQIEEDRKGGWFERNLLRSTSPEWKEFIQAFKEFNDPNHANYMRKDILRPKAQAYMDHKHAQGYDSLSDMKGTSLKRGTLCQSVIDTCDEFDRQEDSICEDIEIEINTGLQGKVGLVISAEEVDVLGDEKVADDNQLVNNPDLDKAFVLDNDDDGVSI